MVDVEPGRPDRFAGIREEALAHEAAHHCGAIPVTFEEARELAVLVRAAHATYVLELGTGTGYRGLHIVDAFGRTGRLDTVEGDQSHAKLAEAAFHRFAYGERVRVHCGRVSEVVPALNGPYDLAVVGSGEGEIVPVYDDLIRLVRTGGSIVASRGSESEAGGLFARLAADDRVAVSFGPGLHQALAVRVR